MKKTDNFNSMKTAVTDSRKDSWPIKTAYLTITAFQEPFIALYAMLAVLLTKNLDASPFQIALLNMLKPTVSVLSFYWGSYLHSHISLTKVSLITATALSTFPFLFSPQIDSVWIFTFLGAWYSLFSRAATPASLELLKLNTEKKERERLFSLASIFAYTIGGIFSLIYGFLLDFSSDLWRWLFFSTAFFHIASTLVQKKISSPEASRNELLERVSKAASETSLRTPWKQAKQLMIERPDFFRFQIGFSIAGFGLMFSQPAIPQFVSGIQLSYIELFVAFSLLKGLGFILTSPLWARHVGKQPIHQLSGSVFFGFSLFLGTLVLTLFHPLWLFVAYFLYGVSQAGSHLVWNLSGSIFSKAENSAPYTSVNVLMVGLRGAIAPPLGGIVTECFGSPLTMTIGAFFCIIGTYLVVSEEACKKSVSLIHKIARRLSNRFRLVP